MLRSAGKFVGTAAGVAASGPASQAQCRAQQSRLPLPLAKDKGAQPAAVLPLSEEELEGEWLVTDLRAGLNGDQVVFGSSEIDDTLQAVLTYARGPRETQISAGDDGSTRIHELGCGQSDSGSDTLDHSDADLQLQAAEMQLANPAAVKDDFTRALSKLLHNPGVQSACVQALKSDPAFAELLEGSSGAAVDVPVHNFSLLPLAAQQATQAEESGAAASMADSLADGLVRLGETIKQRAIGARDVLGRLLIKLGFRIHAILGRPFGVTPLQEADPERASRHAEAVGNALVTIACAILALVLVKRVHRIRFV